MDYCLHFYQSFILQKNFRLYMLHLFVVNVYDYAIP